MNRYRLTSEAEADLIGIWMYIADDSFESADRILDRLKTVFEMLAKQPEAGRSRAEIRPWLRSFVAGRYVIFYRIAPTEIEIMRVLHSARDIERIFEEE